MDLHKSPIASAVLAASPLLHIFQSPAKEADSLSTKLLDCRLLVIHSYLPPASRGKERKESNIQHIKALFLSLCDLTPYHRNATHNFRHRLVTLSLRSRIGWICLDGKKSEESYWYIHAPFPTGHFSVGHTYMIPLPLSHRTRA